MKLKPVILMMGIAVSIASCKKKELNAGLTDVNSPLSGLKKGAATVSGVQSDLAISSSLAYLASDGSGNFSQSPLNDGSGLWARTGSQQFEISSSLATLARDIAGGNRTTAVVNKYVEVVKQILNVPKHNFTVTGGLQPREQYGAFWAIAIGFRQSDIKAMFTTTEQDRATSTMRAGLVASAYVMAAYTSGGVARGNQRVDMRGDPDIWSSPNYAEGYAGIFLAAMAHLGKSTVVSYLNNYNHATLLTELSTNGLTTIHTALNTTFNVTVSGIVYDASTTAKKATLIENYVRYIDNNDVVSKTFYRGYKLSEIIADPVLLTSSLTKFGYDATAMEGDFVGQLGMAQEFDGVDANGVRNSLWYSASAVVNSTYSRYLIEDFGYWTASTATALKTEIDLLMKIGWSDISSKSWNGYWSRKLGVYAYSWMVNYTTGKSWWQRTYDLAHSMGLAKEYYLHDPFQDSNYTAYPVWTATDGTWTFSAVPTFTGSGAGSGTVLDTIVKTNVATLRSRLITTYSGSNYDVTIQCKVNAFGIAANAPQIGLMGRYTDANNFYIMKYNNVTTNCEIIKVVGNVWTTLATSSAITLSTGTVYFLRASFDGSQLKFYVNNVLQVSVTDATFTSGKIGLFAKYTEVMYDDLFVSKPTLN